MSDNATPTTEVIGNKPKLDPSDLITFKFKNKTTGKETETKMLKGTSALNWFYAEHPLGEGRIITEIVQFEPIIVRAEVWVDGSKVATGHANIEGNCTTLKRVETVAIRRALANAGYAADQVIKRIAESIGIDAAKTMLGSGKDKQERKLGAETATDKRNPIAILTAGLEENGTTLELAAVALGIKDANDIEQWRQFGSNAKAIATEVKRANAKPFGQPKNFNGAGIAKSEPTSDELFQNLPAQSAQLAGQLDR